MDVSAAAAAWRRDGFVVMPGYLEGPELAAAQRDLAAVYPTAEEYHAAPAEGRNQAYTGDEFGGIIPFPFPTVALSRLVVHDKLIALAEAIFETTDIRIYASELWAKYSGAAAYEQEHHRDYLNHTPLVPAADDVRWRGLEMFIWLSDVPEDHGPTHLVPLAVTAGVPPLPHGYLRPERPEWYARERSAAGPAGTVVAYSTDTFHRGTEIRASRSARFSAHASYKHADSQWTSRHSWGDRSFCPDWNPFAEQATVRQLQLFGFPPPGHPYWTPQTLRDLAVRYPGLDTRPWQD
jgi:ectoine hydroxylase-related dioxygenase (phytanoyl-CoA dioxygenase family)